MQYLDVKTTVYNNNNNIQRKTMEKVKLNEIQ